MVVGHKVVHGLHIRNSKKAHLAELATASVCPHYCLSLAGLMSDFSADKCYEILVGNSQSITSLVHTLVDDLIGNLKLISQTL